MFHQRSPVQQLKLRNDKHNATRSEQITTNVLPIRSTNESEPGVTNNPNVCHQPPPAPIPISCHPNINKDDAHYTTGDTLRATRHSIRTRRSPLLFLPPSTIRSRRGRRRHSPCNEHYQFSTCRQRFCQPSSRNVAVPTFRLMYNFLVDVPGSFNGFRRNFISLGIMDCNFCSPRVFPIWLYIENNNASIRELVSV